MWRCSASARWSSAIEIASDKGTEVIVLANRVRDEADIDEDAPGVTALVALADRLAGAPALA